MHERLIAGIYPNRKIYFYNKSLSMTSPCIRKCIFDTLYYHRGDNYSLLDPYAGTGIIGIEALSRGSNLVNFFDQQSLVCQDIENNIVNMKNIKGQYNIICTSPLTPPMGKPMDVIYINPLYEKAMFIGKVIKKLYDNNWIDHNTLIVTLSNFQYQRNYDCFKEKKIGNKLLSFFQFNNNLLDKHLFTLLRKFKVPKKRVTEDLYYEDICH